MSLPCVACGRVLGDAMPGLSENQPYLGTAFATRGHYGSTVFDPMDDTALEINVCDACLLGAGMDGRVLHHSGRRVVSWAREATKISDRWDASGILTEGGDAKQAPGESLSSPTSEAGDAQA